MSEQNAKTAETESRNGQNQDKSQDKLSASILEVAEAEKQAGQILERAGEEKAKIISHAKKKAAQLLEEADVKAAAKRDEMLDEARKKANAEKNSYDDRYAAEHPNPGVPHPEGRPQIENVLSIKNTAKKVSRRTRCLMHIKNIPLFAVFSRGDHYLLFYH